MQTPKHFASLKIKIKVNLYIIKAHSTPGVMSATAGSHSILAMPKSAIWNTGPLDETFTSTLLGFKSR
jgi:hypothetical protein